MVRCAIPSSRPVTVITESASTALTMAGASFPRETDNGTPSASAAETTIVSLPPGTTETSSLSTSSVESSVGGVGGSVGESEQPISRPATSIRNPIDIAQRLASDNGLPRPDVAYMAGPLACMEAGMCGNPGGRSVVPTPAGSTGPGRHDHCRAIEKSLSNTRMSPAWAGKHLPVARVSPYCCTGKIFPGPEGAEAAGRWPPASRVTLPSSVPPMIYANQQLRFGGAGCGGNRWHATCQMAPGRAPERGRPRLRQIPTEVDR